MTPKKGGGLMISLVSDAYRIAKTKPIHDDLKIYDELKFDGTIRPWTITAPRASLVLSPKEDAQSQTLRRTEA